MSKNVKPKKWSKAEEERLMKMYRNDKTYGEIGDALGRSYGSVTQRVHILRNLPATIKQAKPKYVEVAEKVLEESKKAKTSDFNKSSPKPLKLNEILTEGQSALKHMTRLVLYAEMLEKQNAALKARLANIEKAIRD
jgi:hypothetical protein